jgi:hypothetical protein
MKKTKTGISTLPFIALIFQWMMISSCSHPVPSPEHPNEMPGQDYVLTGKKTGIGKNITTLLSGCPTHRLENLLNDQFRLVFSSNESTAASVEKCLDRLKTEYDIQKNLIYRVRPLSKPAPLQR